MRHLIASRSRLLFGASALATMFVITDAAFADCVKTANGDSYVCSGAITTNQNITLDATTTKDIKVAVAVAGVRGTGFGVIVVNNRVGSIAITANGKIVASNGTLPDGTKTPGQSVGIFAQNQSTTSKDIAITVAKGASVSDGGGAIYAGPRYAPDDLHRGGDAWRATGDQSPFAGGVKNARSNVPASTLSRRTCPPVGCGAPDHAGLSRIGR